MNPYYAWLIIFGIFAYFIAVDQSIATYVILLWKQSRLKYEKYKWWLMNSPDNFIVRWLIYRRSLETSKKLMKEFEQKKEESNE